MRIVDFHNHYYPPEYMKALETSESSVRVTYDADGNPCVHYPGDYNVVVEGHRSIAERLRVMDEQGIDRALMFPTLASLVEERMRDDPDLTHAVIHALNEWLHEAWTFDYQGRIFTTPVITLPVVEKAIEELEWVVERGAKVVLIRPAPAWGYRGPRSFGLPEFDPFWEKVVEHDVLVAMHSSDSGYERFANEWMGNGSEMLPFEPQAFRMLSAWRPVEDAVAALVCHGALSRFPQLKVAVIENGSSWVEPLLKNLADVYKKMPQDFLEDPVEVVKRNIYISPFWEEDLGALADARLAGRKVIYANPGFTVRINELDETESRSTLDSLFEHILKPEYRYVHQWSVGDVLLWDHIGTWHYAVPDYAPHEHRLMKRCQVLADRIFDPEYVQAALGAAEHAT